MSSITVPGTGGSTVSISNTFGNSTNLALAHQIADALAQASKDGSLSVTVFSGGSLAPDPTSGKLNELLLGSVTGGDVTIPSSDGGWVVVVDTDQPMTIHGGSNTTILGGSQNLTIIDPSVITLADAPGGGPGGNDAVTLTAGDTGGFVGGNNGNDTLTAEGSNQTLAGGFGTNVFFALGANDSVSSSGKGDTIFAGSGGGSFLFTPTATGGLLVGGSGGADVQDAGTGDTVQAGSGGMNVTLSGSSGVVVGSSGGLNVVDGGTSDTVTAGIGGTNVTLTGDNGAVVGGFGFLSVSVTGTSDTITAGAGFSSINGSGATDLTVQGGSGPLNFVGGSSPATILGGSGTASVMGGTGTTEVHGGPNGVVTYINLTSGGLLYGAGTGNETLDAGLSAGQNTIYGGYDTTGHNYLAGGINADLITSGTGSDTMVGGGGADGFFFWAAQGGPSANHFVLDFSTNDYVVLADYGTDAPANAIAGAVTAAGSTTITLSDATKITFVGLTSAAALNGHVFGTDPAA